MLGIPLYLAFTLDNGDIFKAGFRLLLGLIRMGFDVVGLNFVCPTIHCTMKNQEMPEKFLNNLCLKDYVCGLRSEIHMVQLLIAR